MCLQRIRVPAFPVFVFLLRLKGSLREISGSHLVNIFSKKQTWLWIHQPSNATRPPATSSPKASWCPLRHHHSLANASFDNPACFKKVGSIQTTKTAWNASSLSLSQNDTLFKSMEKQITKQVAGSLGDLKIRNIHIWRKLTAWIIWISDNREDPRSKHTNLPAPRKQG